LAPFINAKKPQNEMDWGKHPMAPAKYLVTVAPMTANYIPHFEDSKINPFQSQPIFGQRILVVEDEHDLRRLTAEALIDAGYQVDVAEDGATAWSALQLFKYDLLITDQFMPKLSGVELLRKIHAADMTLPTIMATGFLPTWEFILHPCLQPVKMLLKPYSPQKLLGMVKNILHSSGSAGLEIPQLCKSQIEHESAINL
jgi:DNA-binding response OmpR family regulator